MPADSKRSSVPSYFLAASATVLAVSPFFSWVDAIFLGSVSLIDAFKLGGNSPDEVYLAVGALVVLAVLALARVPGASVFGLVAGGAALLYAGNIVVNASSVIGDAQGAVRLGAGAYIAAAAAVAVLIASIAAMTRGRF